MIVIMSTPLDTFLAAMPTTDVSFDPGQFVFARGDAVRRMFQVVHGEVHLMRHQRDGTAIIVQRAGPGCVLAEASLLVDRYHCDAVAAQPTRVRSRSRQALTARLAKDSGFARAWIAHLAGEVQAARLRIEIVSMKTVSARLDAWLAWHDGLLPAKGAWKSIATEIGVSPEALYRELGRRRDGP